MAGPLIPLALLPVMVSVPPTFASLRQDPNRAPSVLETALASSRAGVRVGALRALTEEREDAWLPELSLALRDGEAAVRTAAYDALGRSKSPSAFDVLAEHYRARRGELLRDDAELARFLLALADRRDERAIALLAADVAAQSGPLSLRARFMGLGLIRSRASLDALVAVMEALPFAERQQHLQDFRVAMIVLTGRDQGRTLDAWVRWWRAQPADLALAPADARIAGPEGERWRMFWRSRPR